MFYRLILLCWLTCCSLVVMAASTQLGRSTFTPAEQQWLAVHDELVVGMPATAWPPYVYTDGRGNFTGPLDAFASQIAGSLGLELRYRTYANNTAVQQALLDGKIDMVIGVAPSPIRKLQMLFTSALMALPRAVLLTGGRESLSLEEAYGVRWVCVFGVSACDELLRLGISNLITADSRDEAIFMLKEGKADAYLAEMRGFDLAMISGWYSQDSYFDQRQGMARPRCGLPWLGWATGNGSSTNRGGSANARPRSGATTLAPGGSRPAWT